MARFPRRRRQGSARTSTPPSRPDAVPAGWIFVPAGDAGLTRRLTTGPHAVHIRGRIRLGVWTPPERLRAAQAWRAAHPTSTDPRSTVLKLLRFSAAHAAAAERLCEAILSAAPPARAPWPATDDAARSAAFALLMHYARTQSSLAAEFPQSRTIGIDRNASLWLQRRVKETLAPWRRKGAPPEDCPLVPAASDEVEVEADESAP